MMECVEINISAYIDLGVWTSLDANLIINNAEDTHNNNNTYQNEN